MDARALTIALGGRWCSRYGLAACPTHDDRSPSLKIKDDPRKSDGIDLHCFAGCRWQDVKAELQQRGLVETNGKWKAPPPPNPTQAGRGRHQAAHRICGGPVAQCDSVIRHPWRTILHRATQARCSPVRSPPLPPLE